VAALLTALHHWRYHAVLWQTRQNLCWQMPPVPANRQLATHLVLRHGQESIILPVQTAQWHCRPTPDSAITRPLWHDRPADMPLLLLQFFVAVLPTAYS